MAIPDSLQFKQLRPISRFSYELDYALQIPKREGAKPTITGEFTVNVRFGHGQRRKHPPIEDIQKKAEREISELFSKFVDSLQQK